MKPSNSNEIRQAFLDFFEEMGHEVVASSPLPIHDNPTLLFTNAGMNQFVDTFLGKEERPYSRAASSQKCMRVQGKHNDLENVGPSPRHHTFFEMLGNFSFGDYFKSGAIRFAFDFLTKVCEIPEDRLWYTVYENDDEAYDIWLNEIGVSPERVLRMGEATNFWMMGDVGPCGPTSEVHYDWGPEYDTCGDPNCSVLLDNDCGRWLEIWNLVFMQFNQDENGDRTPLPRPGVDTGLGLERITSIIEGKAINYSTDLFSSAMDRVQSLLADSEEERQAHETGYRVIADHCRAATFLLADGVLPGNVGGGYVLRMIIRRASRFGRMIGFGSPFQAEIAKVYIEAMESVYPELLRNSEHILHTLTLEEERFARSLDKALLELDEILGELHRAGQSNMPGDTAFNLYATHGLPVEITRDVAGERGILVDEKGFQEAREAHSIASGVGAFGRYDAAESIYADLLAELILAGHLDSHGVDYDPYSGPEMEAEVVGILLDGRPVREVRRGQSAEIITSATPFYVEAGGEVSDIGVISSRKSGGKIAVVDMRQPVSGLIVHVAEAEEGEIAIGDVVDLEVDDARRWDIRRNHTATHVLHQELRERLGKHVTQQGSLVAPDRLRFDFSHGQALDEDVLDQIEEAINAVILSNQPIDAEHMQREDAIAAGAMALFGEKYGNIVRTIRIGGNKEPYSLELCGGLHVDATGDIGLFHFTGEEAIGSGLRRVEAITGRYAQSFVKQRLKAFDRLAHRLNAPVIEAETRVDSLLAENRALQKDVRDLRRARAREQFAILREQMQSVSGVPLLSAVVDVTGKEDIREMADWFRDSVGSGVAVIGAAIGSRAILAVAVTEDLVGQGLKAGDIIARLAPIIGGGGGGRPTLAEAGGKDAEKLPELVAAVPGVIAELMQAN
jgi:alanyl-tRNA synthetase